MRFAFTEYVRALVGAGSGGRPPENGRFQAAWDKLRSTLVSELRKRSLWGASPSYLAVFGYSEWSQEGALDELLVDCFAFVFLERLPSLEAQLKAREKKAAPGEEVNIEGLIFLSIRNFLYDTQRKHDPLGFRVFERLHAAARQLIASGTLFILNSQPGSEGEAGAPKSRIGNETLLAFQADSREEAARNGKLDELVKGWADDLLPELMIARGKKKQAMIDKLADHLAGLSEHGIEAFRFNDVITPFKRDVRTRWNAIWWQAEGEMGFEASDEELLSLVRLVRPDPGPEERDAFRKLLACVEERLDRHEDSDEKELLRKSWEVVRSYAAEDEDKAPSRRRIAEQLNLPRDRVENLFKILRRWIEDCRRS